MYIVEILNLGKKYFFLKLTIFKNVSVNPDNWKVMGKKNIEKKVIQETILLLVEQFENFLDKHELSEEILLLLQESTNYFEWSVGLNKGDEKS